MNWLFFGLGIVIGALIVLFLALRFLVTPALDVMNTALEIINQSMIDEIRKKLHLEFKHEKSYIEELQDEYTEELEKSETAELDKTFFEELESEEK